MKTVLCITLNPAIDLTITLDVLTLGAVNRASENQLGAAGKGLNAAHVLSELGINAIASGFLGDDNDEIFERLFKSHKTFIGDAGIGQLTDGFVKVTGATRTNVKIVDKQGCTTDINGQGFLIDNDAKQALFKRLIQYAKENHITTIFAEEMASPEVSKTLAQEVGAKVETIYTIESNEDDKTYLQRMDENLTKILASLQ